MRDEYDEIFGRINKNGNICLLKEDAESLGIEIEGEES